LKIIAMSDLHLSKKPWQVRKALKLGAEADLVLLCGDLTNDGKPEQLERMRCCIADILPDTPVLAVAGNHDYLRFPVPAVREGICDYPALQTWLLDRLTCPVTADSSGAWAADLGAAEIIGLNCVSHWRRFRFPHDEQLDWLERRLEESAAPRHIILCHAPLLAHNPKRSDTQPYLSRDRRLQNIVDAHRNIVFISGHTHVSMESPIPCVEWDEERNNIYINDGSIRPATLLGEDGKPLQQPAAGNVVELILEGGQLTVTPISVEDGEPICGVRYCFSK